MQPDSFDLVGTIIYEIDEHPYQSTFFNGTVEVVEYVGFLSIESVFLVTLGIALLVLLGLWIHGHVQNLSKDYNAKLSDFGLAKDGPTGDKSHFSTRRWSSPSTVRKEKRDEQKRKIKEGDGRIGQNCVVTLKLLMWWSGWSSPSSSEGVSKKVE
ncbi:translocon-associated protein subunit alpha-like, partial [Trifolium medium]|nr:translocon-associated protein subunit alpha-like [Trifolium medium]